MERFRLEPFKTAPTTSSEVGMPRSVPFEPSLYSNSVRSAQPQNYAESSNTSIPISHEMGTTQRSMKISSLLNADDESSHGQSQSAGRHNTYHHQPDLRDEAHAFSNHVHATPYNWRVSNVPSPSDDTSSFLEDGASSERDLSAPSPDDGTGGRENRPAYLVEEDTFIWYHRDDRGMKWDDVSAAFNQYFPADRHRHGLQGIQGRYYRILKDEGVPKLRSRQKKKPRRDYGVVARTTRRYPWMNQS